MDKSPRHGGFTLIELMIAVAIIGIIAAIAIPNFIKYTVKARQSEVGVNLKAIYTLELSYHGEHNIYTPYISGLGWQPITETLYRYTAGGDFGGNPSPGGTPMMSAPPGADATNFTAVAWGNIDKDPAIDTWQITGELPLANVYNDLVETQAR